MPKHVWRRSIRNDFGSVVSDSTETVESDSEENCAGVAPAGDLLEIDLAIDVSQIQSMFISSNKNVTVNTNDNGTPVDTFAIVGGSAVAWKVTDTGPCPLGTNVTKLFFNNGGADDATVRAGFILNLAP